MGERSASYVQIYISTINRSQIEEYRYYRQSCVAPRNSWIGALAVGKTGTVNVFDTSPSEHHCSVEKTIFWIAPTLTGHASMWYTLWHSVNLPTFHWVEGCPNLLITFNPRIGLEIKWQRSLIVFSATPCLSLFNHSEWIANYTSYLSMRVQSIYHLVPVTALASFPAPVLRLALDEILPCET